MPVCCVGADGTEVIVSTGLSVSLGNVGVIVIEGVDVAWICMPALAWGAAQAARNRKMKSREKTRFFISAALTFCLSCRVEQMLV